MAIYIRKKPKDPNKPSKVEKKRLENPHLQFVQKNASSLTAPTVRKIYEEAMRGIAHAKFMPIVKAWQEKYNVHGDFTKIEEHLKTFFALLANSVDKKVKWSKKDEATEDTRDAKLDKLQETLIEFRASFQGKVNSAKKTASAGRTQAQRLEKELKEKTKIIMDEIQKLHLEILKQSREKQDEITQIEFYLKKCIRSIRLIYTILKCMDWEAYKTMMFKSRLFRNVEIDNKTYVIFTYTQKTINKKQEALKIFKKRQTTLATLSHELKNFIRIARKNILDSNGFSKQERSEFRYIPVCYKAGETPFFHLM